MALSLYWPGRYHSYPIGNTSPVCLTRDVPPEAPTSILVLACGDPRNILYTVFCEAPSMERSLDFTCCDFDPGILARNVLLLTMIIDGVPEQTAWNIFYHMYLDSSSRSTLVSQSQKLTSYPSIEEWRSSPYGSAIRMGTDHTLVELRRHWQLYADFYHPTKSRRLTALKEMMEGKRKAAVRDHALNSVNLTSSRSSGPLLARRDTILLLSEHFNHFWKTGTTFTDPTLLAASTHPNSTFFYSRAHEGFNVHYGTDPMITFHHAPALGNTDGTLTIGELVESAKLQFRAWCSAFRTAATTWKNGALIVRFLLGDAFSVSRALQVWPSNAGIQTPGTHTAFKLAQWTACTVELNREEYANFGAPLRFDVVDTLNLCDDVGMHNVFLCATPLLANVPTSVLYTESLLVHTADPTTELQTKLFAHLSVIALLLDLAPIDALCGFTTRCNTHELVIAQTFLPMSTALGKKQYHQVLTWKRPSSGDPSACTFPALSFDTLQFAHLLHKIYLHLFEHEDPVHFRARLGRTDVGRAIVWASSWCPSRESFVMLLALVHARLQIPAAQWSDIVRKFLEILYENALTQHPFDAIGHNEIHAQLYRYGLYTVPGLDHACRPTSGPLSHWLKVPPLVRVFLTVPRASFGQLKSVSDRLPTPWLHCSIKHPRFEHGFQSVDAAYGTVVDSGTNAAPDISIVEDRDALTVAFSFVVPGCLLTQFPPNDIYIRIGARTSPAASEFLTPILGSALAIFTTSLQDTNHVHLAPEQPFSPQPFSGIFPARAHDSHLDSPTAIGTQQSVHVTLDVGEGKRVASLTARLDVENAQAKAIIAGDAMPHVSLSQMSPCTVQVVLDGLTQTLVYPLPIVGSQRKLRIVRKSSYIEVIVPVAIPFLHPDGYKLNPFPIVRVDQAMVAWNLHRVPLDRLPILNIEPSNATVVGKWYNPHVSSQMSARESALKAAKQRDVDVLANIKDTIHFLMVRGAGTQGATPARIIALRDDVTDDSDTIFFVDKIRFDVAAHTVVCDAFVLPLCPPLMRTMGPLFVELLNRGVVNVRVYGGEMRAWKRLLPALVERCRTTWTHGANCEYVATGKIPLELETGEGDPLCGCGRGKDVDGMLRDGLWKKFAPFVTRVAISPLFAVSYLEPVFGRHEEGGDPGASASHPHPEPNVNGTTSVARCSRCRKRESSALKLLRCGRCRTALYCSKACQKGDWKTHKLQCKN
ncbi:hypothetical protein LXA43DRAFT_1133680 [Ganoderma leucocontextum]|nr:hypothetical protein LXA43DRAFT_1133680 [Ganoderma leucocontextum]